MRTKTITGSRVSAAAPGSCSTVLRRPSSAHLPIRAPAAPLKYQQHRYGQIYLHHHSYCHFGRHCNRRRYHQRRGLFWMLELGLAYRSRQQKPRAAVAPAAARGVADFCHDQEGTSGDKEEGDGEKGDEEAGEEEKGRRRKRMRQ